jgi:putative ABC transport system permease protein
MQIRDIAIQSLRRRPSRSAFVVLALTFAIGTLVALIALTQTMRAEVGDELDQFGANIVITPRNTALALAYGALEIAGLDVDARKLTPADADVIRTIPNKRNIAAVAPKLIGTARANDQPVVLVGARFPEENGVKTWWQVNGRLPASAGEALIGAEAAERLGATIGTPLTIEGQALAVVGTIAMTGSLDDQSVFADLAQVQQLLGRPGELTVIEVSALCKGCPIEDIVQQIAAVIPHARVAPIRQAVAAREQMVGQLTQFAYLVALVVVLAGGLVIMTTTLASLVERTREIGLLRAIGFRRSHVVRVVLLEVVTLSIVGGLLGWLTGTGAAALLGPAVGQITTPIRPDLFLALGALGLAAALGIAAGTYPALRAASSDPTDSFRAL